LATETAKTPGAEGRPKVAQGGAPKAQRPGSPIQFRVENPSAVKITSLSLVIPSREAGEESAVDFNQLSRANGPVGQLRRDESH
jgi:hypothetical protein